MENQVSKGELVSKGAMGLLVGLSLMLAGIWVSRQLHIVWNIWPSTDGVVVGGTVQDVLVVPHAKGGVPFHSYTPKIEFRYRVSGRDYTTEAPSVRSAATYDRAAANLTGLYAPGTHHPIRYNPRNPRDIQFGTIDFGPLAYSFLLLIFGAALSAIGLSSLVRTYLQHGKLPPMTARQIPATVMPFPSRAPSEPSAATVICPGCGRRVVASEDNCPNCLKFLHAA
jgi:hypothetical protein